MSANYVSLVVPDFEVYYNQDYGVRKHQTEDIVSTVSKAVAELTHGLINSFPVDGHLLSQLLAQKFDSMDVPITQDSSSLFENYDLDRIEYGQAQECVFVNFDDFFYYVIHKATPQQLEAGQLPDQGSTLGDLPIGTIIEGRLTSDLDNTQIGRFVQVRQGHFELKFGKVILAKGSSLEGQFAYNPFTNKVFMERGVKKYKDQLEIAHWIYNKDTKPIGICPDCDSDIENKCNAFEKNEEINSKLSEKRKYILKELINIRKFAHPNFNRSPEMLAHSKKIDKSINAVHSVFSKLIHAKPFEVDHSFVQTLRTELTNAVRQLQIFTHPDKNGFFGRSEDQIETAKVFHERLRTIASTLSNNLDSINNFDSIEKLVQNKKNLAEEKTQNLNF